MKIIPPTMTTEQAIRSGMCGRIECAGYTRWLKTLPCDTCGRHGTEHNPIDPSHFNGYKGAGTKAPDLMAMPQCRECHERYERLGMAAFCRPGEPIPEVDLFLARCMLYIVRAFWEDRLKWKN